MKWLSYIWFIGSLQGKIVNHMTVQFVFCNWLPQNSLFCSFSLGIPARNWQLEDTCPLVLPHHKSCQQCYLRNYIPSVLITVTTSKEKDIDDVSSFTFMDVFVSSITISSCRKISVYLWIINIARQYIVSVYISWFHSLKRLVILIRLIKWKK